MLHTKEEIVLQVRAKRDNGDEESFNIVIPDESCRGITYTDLQDAYQQWNEYKINNLKYFLKQENYIIW